MYRAARRFAAGPERLEARRCLTDLFFGQAVELPYSYGSSPLVAADFDSDGDTDILHRAPSALALTPNIDGRNFGPPLPEWGKSAESLDLFQAVDIDQDRDLDIVAYNFAVNQQGPVWFENLDGRGRFGEQPIPITSITSHNFASLLVGDSDHDGDADFFIGFTDGVITRLENLGAGQFAAAETITTELGGTPYSMAMGDLDGDTNLDLLATVFGSQRQSMVRLMGLDGRAAFSSPRLIDEAVGGTLLDGAVVDLDADGDLDAIATRSSDGSSPFLVVFYENAGGEFGRYNEIGRYTSGSWRRHALDFDRDGDIDLVDEEGGWFENLGQTRFSNRRIIATGEPTRSQIEDFDKDGDMDFLRGNLLYRNLSEFYPLTSPIKANNDTDLSVAANASLLIRTATILANDTKAAGTTLSVGAVDGRTLQGSSVSQLVETASLTLDPSTSETLRRLPLGLSVMDQFSYTATDGRSESSALVTVRIDGVNDPPVATNDVMTIAENAELLDITNFVLANDSDIDAGDEIRIVSLSGAKGEAIITDGRVLYRPGEAFDTLFVGQEDTDLIEYTIADKLGAQATATLVVTIRGESDVPGDFDGNGSADVLDIDLLCTQINRSGYDALFDLNDNGEVSQADLDTLVLGLMATTYGDANLDRIFDSADLIQIFQSGTYEDSTEDNSSWATGDWNCDREFDSSDLIRAFQGGGYRLG